MTNRFRWVDSPKVRFRVSSRHITEFVSLKSSKDPEKTLKLVEKLCEDVNKIMSSKPGIEFCNCDQTGLVKECHGMRTIEESESQSTIEEFYFTFCHVANYWKQ